MESQQAVKRPLDPSSSGDGESSKQKRRDFSQLLSAVKRGSIMGVKQELTRLGETPADESAFKSALSNAALHGRKYIVQLLLLYKIDISGHVGEGLVINAINQGYMDIASVFIKSGAPVNESIDRTGQTTLMSAVKKGCASLITELLQHGADVNAQDKDGRTALMHAVDACDFTSVQRLLAGGKCDLNIEDEEGFTVYKLAKATESEDLLSVFIRSQSRKEYPLILAAYDNDVMLVRKLIEIPYCKISYKTKKGLTPLLAALVGPKNIGTSKRRRLKGCNMSMMKVLVKPDANLDQCHPTLGVNALMIASIAGFEELVKLLLDNGANVNEKTSDEHGVTPITFAAQQGHSKIIELLCAAGADLTLIDAEALDVALSEKDKAAVMALLKLWPSKLTDAQVEAMSESSQEIFNSLLEVYDRWDSLLDTASLEAVFYQAIKAKHAQLVSAVIKYNKIDLNGSVKGQPALMHVINSNSLVILSLLLDEGANVNVQNAEGETALMEAVKAGDCGCVEKLVNAKADMFIASQSHHNAISLACQQECNDALVILLKNCQDVNRATNSEKSPLMAAVEHGNLEAVRMLIQQGARVNTSVGETHTTPLMEAAYRDSLDIVKLLIDSGADMNAEDILCETPLFHAVLDDDLESSEEEKKLRVKKVSLLLEHKADPNHPNFEFRTPLMYAARTRNPEVVRLLVSNGACISDTDADDMTALHHSLYWNDTEDDDLIEIMTFLLALGADINAFDICYVTPLLHALSDWMPRSVKLLLVNGAEVNFFHSKEERHKWLVNLSEDLEDCDCDEMTRKKFRKYADCLEPLLEAGCYLAMNENSLICRTLNELFACCVKTKSYKLITLLLQGGFAPCLITRSMLFTMFPDSSDWNELWNSTMCIAICSGQPELVSLFSQARFFHTSDFHMLQQPFIQDSIKKMLDKWPTEKLEVPSELTPKTWSLQTWSMLAVSRAVGFNADRRARVQRLPMPIYLKDALLFKNITPLNEPVDEEDLAQAEVPEPAEAEPVPAE